MLTPNLIINKLSVKFLNSYTNIRMKQLSWDATYAIALELKRQHADQSLDDISLRQIYLWTIALPDFSDDPTLANEDILADIYQVWYEETIHDHK
jgi:FeS assembly protein IscX